jgi:hypothetical protein
VRQQQMVQARQQAAAAAAAVQAQERQVSAWPCGAYLWSSARCRLSADCMCAAYCQRRWRYAEEFGVVHSARSDLCMARAAVLSALKQACVNCNRSSIQAGGLRTRAFLP